uniref:ZM domain-containing protein n=1 Tax=Syphacia muris TaxID=451379 RepID=A0A0N5ABZ6_9BILA
MEFVGSDQKNNMCPEEEKVEDDDTDVASPRSAGKQSVNVYGLKTPTEHGNYKNNYRSPSHGTFSGLLEQPQIGMQKNNASKHLFNPKYPLKKVVPVTVKNKRAADYNESAAEFPSVQFVPLKLTNGSSKQLYLESTNFNRPAYKRIKVEQL